MNKMKQELKWDEKTNKCTLETLNDDGSITSKPLTVEEATQWQAENKF